MNYKMLGRFISMILAIETASMAPALLISLVLRETGSIVGFLSAMAAAGAASAILSFLSVIVLCRIVQNHVNGRKSEMELGSDEEHPENGGGV